MSKKPNFILMTDSYKLTHAQQYPSGTQMVHSYMEARGGFSNEIVMFGTQYYLQTYLAGCVIEQWMIEEAEQVADLHFGRKGLFNREGWQMLLDVYQGRLPISIYATPEGTIVKQHDVLMTIENNDERFWWLTNAIETLMLKLWYPITVATLSREIKKVILDSLELTGDPSLIDFKLHDFGYRGVSSEESAAIGGAAHLVNFKGTDTLKAVLMLRDCYDEPMAGFSIPASEHSTITSWTRKQEVDAYDNMLSLYPEGAFACVSDSYNIFDACEKMWGGELKDKVTQRDGTVIIRPDSGDPLTVLPKVLRLLGDAFGYTVNDKGYRVLDPHVRVIWGDGINLRSVKQILEVIEMHEWSADNVAFGMGGALLQQVHRDSLQFAFKCSAIEQDGAFVEVYKDPVNSPSKASKRGLQTPVGASSVNKLVFYNGSVHNNKPLSVVRERAKVDGR
jgi:nicotinamide phosphoribosyltransferase